MMIGDGAWGKIKEAVGLLAYIYFGRVCTTYVQISHAATMLCPRDTLAVTIPCTLPWRYRVRFRNPLTTLHRSWRVSKIPGVSAGLRGCKGSRISTPSRCMTYFDPVGVVALPRQG